MRYVLLCLFLLGCRPAGYSIIALPHKAYGGKTGATEPHIRTGRAFLTSHGCVSNLCTYSVSVRPKVHNPLPRYTCVFGLNLVG